MTKKESAGKNMGWYHLKQQNLTLYPWLIVCVDLVGSFTIRALSKTRSLLVLTTIDPEISTG
jgi:hypothetical protein